MAVIYLRSTDGSDSDNGSTWALAKATLAAALTAAGAGGTVYVSDNHAETQNTAMTLTSPGTAAAPVTVICVNDSGNPQPPTARLATATVTTTSTSHMTFNGFAYVYGITFNVGTAAGSSQMQLGTGTPFWWKFEQCNLNIISTNSAGAGILVGQTNASATDDHVVELINTTVRFSATAQAIFLYANLRWVGGSLNAAGSLPTVLIRPGSVPGVKADLIGVDLSAAGSGQALWLASSTKPSFLTMKDCKLGSSVAISSGTIAGQGGAEAHVVDSDSADTNYRYYRESYLGTIQHETTIVRTGGASDGTTPISRVMESSAAVKVICPLVSDPIVMWNETVGSSVSVEIETVTDNVTLKDNECWVVVEYLGTSGFPLALVASDANSEPILSSGSNQASSTVTWTTTGLTTPVKQKLGVTFTPQEKGTIRAYVVLAKASTTVYFDPLILTGSKRQWQSMLQYVNEGIASIVATFNALMLAGD
jgi:hypothetical protein